MKDQGDWLKQAGELQQRYWDGWRELTGQAMAPAGRPVNTPWQDGLDAWNRALGATDAGSGRNNVAERMLAHGKQYLELLQGLTGGHGFSSGQAFDPRAWLEEMRTLHERYGQSAMPSGQGAFPWFGGVDQDQIEQMVKAFTVAPVRGIQQDWHSWLGVPAFGLTREHQERGQALLQAWFDYQAANTRYNDLMFKATAKTFDALQSRLAEREDPGRQITSARALYDLWIDAAEEAFADVAMSADYRTVYGDLVNAQMRVRAGLNAEIERFGAQFGLPTRTEIDSLARQVHDLKRELRRLSGYRGDGVAASGRPGAGTAAREESAVGEKSRRRRASALTSAQPAARRAPAEAGKAKKNKKPKLAKKAARSANETPSIRSTARKAAKGS